MITTNSSGSALSSAYATTIQADSRDFLSQLYIGNSQVDCSITKWTITKGSVGSDTEFSVGNIISSHFQAEVKELTQTVKNQLVEVRIGLMVGNAYEWVTIGKFYITDVKTDIYTAKLEGYGRIVAKSSGGFAEPTNRSLSEVARMLGVGMGCTVSFDSGITTSLVIAEPMNGITNYQALQILASVVGGYAIDTPDGNVKICKFSNTTTHSVDAGLMGSLPTVAEQDYQITGVRCVIAEASNDGTAEIPAIMVESGSPINLEMNNKWMTDNLFQSMATRLIGCRYRPAEINLSLGDPRIEGNDVLSVTDADGTVYTVPCHLVTHTYDGGLATEIKAVDATEINNSIGTMTPIQRALASLGSSVVKAETIADQGKAIAEDTNQYFWFIQEGGTVPLGIGTGAHITEVPQDDFIANPSGGNLLARSNGIALRVGLTELLTLATSGITFDSSTPFTIGTENAYITFSPTENKIYIGGSNIVLGDVPLSETLADIATLKQQVATITDELGNIFELSIYTTWGTDTVTHRAELLKNGQDVAGLAEYVNDLEWCYKLNNGLQYIGFGRTITVDQADYAHAVIVTWTRREYKYLLNNAGDNLITSTGDTLMGRTEY